MKKLAFSPCPNDTFIFGAWANGWVAADLKVQVELLDIEALNIALRRGQFDIQKVSAITALQCLSDYEILPVGGALGYGVGPIVASKEKLSLNDLKGKKVAFPGEGTTAHFLFQLFGPLDIHPVFTRFDKIIPMIQKKEVDAGVLIHEGRFIVDQEKLYTIADLGALWEEREELPLPLGVTAVKKDFPYKSEAIEAIQHSIHFARQNLEKVYPYIVEHAQNKNPEIIREHISTFVNRESEGLTDIGQRALLRFYERGKEIGLFHSEETPFRLCYYS